MKIILCALLISLLISACGSPTPLATPTLQLTATPAPTSTPSPTSTPAPTPTPAPVALAYKGWTDKAFSSVCVEGVHLTEEEEKVLAALLSATKDLLSAMGMEVSPIGDSCEVTIFIGVYVDMEAEHIFKANGEICSTYKELIVEGYFDFFGPVDSGGEVINLTINDELKFPDPYKNCGTSIEPPYDLLWPKMLLKAFYELYGEQALQAAESVPVLQPFVSEIAR